MNVARVFVTYGSFYTQSGQLDAKGLAAFDCMLDLADEAIIGEDAGVKTLVP
jgi:hypothetical protein